jgi:hypothetical protein
MWLGDSANIFDHKRVFQSVFELVPLQT